MASLTLLPRLYPILDTGTLSRLGIEPLCAAEALLQGGAEILQFRHKGLWSRSTFSIAESIRDLCGSIPFVVNDRGDYARLLNANLHVGQEDLAPELVRPLIGDVTLGFSTHNRAQVEDARSQPIDYLAFGPIFGTASKDRPDPCTGLDELRAVRGLTTLPLVAIGGITRENASACWKAGADSVAVIADLLPAPCSKDAIRERMRQWRQLS